MLGGENGNTMLWFAARWAIFFFFNTKSKTATTYATILEYTITKPTEKISEANDKTNIMNTPLHSKEVVDLTDDYSISAICADVSAVNITDEATDTSSHTAKKLSAPETPRWRFVNKAKKTEGYSSSAAGTFVKGGKTVISRGGLCEMPSSPLSCLFVCANIS
jgi:hypothetical protein